MLPVLRPYQRQMLDDIDSAPGQRPMVVLPTGGGKTIVFAEAIRRAVAARRSALVIAHRREIIGQTSDKLRDVGVVHGIIMAGVEPRPDLDVQVASIQTLFSRGIRRETMEMPAADLLIIDEAHHARADTYQRVAEAYPSARMLGFTATPERNDGRGLGETFDVIVEGPQVPELIELGFLVPTRVYAPHTPDLTGVKTVGGDYVAKQLEERMDKASLVGDIVEQWLKRGEGRKTVVFASGVGHSVHIRDRFLEAGVCAAHIDGTTPKDERDAALAQLADGEISVLSNCQVLTEGWDCPPISCCILARPTKSHGLHRQMVGRTLRPADGKTDAIVIDHAGNVFRHGFVDDHVEWTLRPDTKAARNRAHDQHDDRLVGPRIVECTNCGAVRTAGNPCGHCGFMPVARPRYVVAADGDLGLVNRERRVPAQDWTQEKRQDFYQQLLGYAAEHQKKPGLAFFKYREKFPDHKPPYTWRDLPPKPPTPAVLAWIKSRTIAWMRAQARPRPLPQDRDRGAA